MGIARWALWLKASSEACEMTSKGAMSALRLQSMSFNGHIQQNRTECSATHLERNRQISFNHQGFNDSAIPTESRNLLGCPASAALRHFACNSAHGATVAADPASKHGWATLQLHHLWHHGWHQFDIQIRTIHLTSIIIFWADQFYCWTSIGISTVRPSTPWSLPRISAPKRAAEASPVSELAPASSPLSSNTDQKIIEDRSQRWSCLIWDLCWTEFFGICSICISLEFLWTWSWPCFVQRSWCSFMSFRHSALHLLDFSSLESHASNPEIHTHPFPLPKGTWASQSKCCPEQWEGVCCWNAWSRNPPVEQSYNEKFNFMSHVNVIKSQLFLFIYSSAANY